MAGQAMAGRVGRIAALCLVVAASARGSDLDGLRSVADASFERRDGAWTTAGSARVVGRAYRGRHALELGPGATAVQALAPAAGETVAFGAWLRVEDAGAVGAVELVLHAVAAGGTRTLVGRASLDAHEPRRWHFVETPAGSASGALVVGVVNGANARVLVDDVQVGAPRAVTGNPPKLVTLNFLGRYRSPLFAGSTTAHTDPRQIWRNWCWIEPPACDPNETGFFHNPDCATSATCFRANGRRDVASSVEAGLDELPMFGAYDSRDPDLLRTQLDLAEAIGFDSVVYLHQGHALAEQDAGAGFEPLNEQCFEALLDAAEAPGRTLKVAVMYEPKVHLLGWVAGQPTKAQKLDGLEEDLVHLVETYASRPAFLRHEGRPVLYVFRNDVCNPAGLQCLTDADWQALAAAVLARTGEQPFFVADVPPAGPSPFGGLSRWQLVALELMKYRTFAAVQAGVPSRPAPALASLTAHASAINAVATTWRDQAPEQRIAVALAWPGFDDSGVGGWASGNFPGEDGHPLCVRVADDQGGAFYGETVQAAVASGADWLQVATWNDWNEGTQIEPRWNASYVGDVLAGKVPKRPAFNDAFARAIETQQAIAAFKGVPYKKGKQVQLHRAAVKYLRKAAQDPGVAQYD